MTDWQWLLPTVPAAVSAVVAILLYRHNRTPRWRIERIDKSAIELTYDGHRNITDVRVAVTPVSSEGTRSRDLLSHGGTMRVSWFRRLGQPPADTVTVTWRSRWRSHTWTSGI